MSAKLAYESFGISPLLRGTYVRVLGNVPFLGGCRARETAVRRISGIARSRKSRVGLVSGVAVAAIIAFAVPAGANTGHVFTSQTCYTWSASVTLDNNVTTVRRVEVTTTIPGTTGIVDGHYAVSYTHLTLPTKRIV